MSVIQPRNCRILSQIVHKPGNIKITPHGRVKVLDFGLAKVDAAATGEAEGTGRGLTNAPTVTSDVGGHDLVALPNMPSPYLAWSPDGRQLAIAKSPASTNAAVFRFNPDAEQPLQLLADLPTGTRLRGATWSADGSSLLIGQIQSSTDIVLFDQGGAK